MAFTYYDMATLLEVRRRQVGIVPFWLKFFGRQMNFETKFIDFERVNRRYKKLAPFVAPNVQGRVITTQGSTMQRFAPAYVKPKSVIDPQKVLVRQPGEVQYQALSNAQRRDAVIAEEVKEHRIRIENREEWLAAHALINGTVTISGEDYPAQTVDFGRDASLTNVLAGAAKWDVSTGTPLADLKLMRQRTNTLSGQAVRKIVFGQNAWNLLTTRLELDDPQNGNLLDTNFKGSGSDVTRMFDGFNGAEYVGRLAGRDGQGAFDCWVYFETYDDDAGAEQPFLNTNDVVGIGDIDGVRCYGAIHDPKAGYQALSVFMKNWVNEDPAVEYLLSQSAPLMVPGEPNASFRMRVA